MRTTIIAITAESELDKDTTTTPATCYYNYNYNYKIDAFVLHVILRRVSVVVHNKTVLGHAREK